MGLLIIMWYIICVVIQFPVLAAPFSNHADGKQSSCMYWFLIDLV